MANSKKEESENIKYNMNTIFNKISNNSTINVGYEMLKKLVNESPNDNKMSVILQCISEHINSLKRNEKKESIKLLSVICAATKSKNIHPFLSRILTILQMNILDENASIFTIIATTYGEIVEKCLLAIDTDISEQPNENKKTYELLQGFCIYNMKQEIKANQICGSLCLTALIETSPMVLQPAYMKYLWENIVYFIDKSSFMAQSELLNSLISLIFAAESLFRSFATVTLYKILEFLTNSDWFKRKLALNVVYTLFIYCQDEIQPLKGHIIDFLKVLKSDKVKEVREVCLQTLKLFNENVEPIEEEKTKNNASPKKARDNNIKDITPRNGMKNNATNNTGIPPKYTTNNKKNDKSIRLNDEDSLNLSELKAFDITPVNKNKADKKLTDKDVKSIENLMNNSHSVGNSPKNEKVNDNSKRPKTPVITSSKTNENYSKKASNNNVNRSREKVFVNAKMVIKRNPSYSIFKTKGNSDFFQNAPENGIEILVKDKKEETKASRDEDDRMVNYVKPKSEREKTIDKKQNKIENKIEDIHHDTDINMNLNLDNDIENDNETSFSKYKNTNKETNRTNNINKTERGKEENNYFTKSLNKEELDNNLNNGSINVADILKQMKDLSDVNNNINLIETNIFTGLYRKNSSRYKRNSRKFSK